MDYRYLGKTGLKVSELCLGAMTFGREADEKTSFAMMDAFAEAGGNFIDTADVYSQGISEEVLGRWLANQNRDDFVIATKVRFGMGEGINDVGLSRRHIMDSITKSLERLQTNYVDLYQVHCYDPGTPLRETMKTLNNLVESGMVRYLGASNFKGYQIQKANDIANAHGWEPFSSLQPLYNLLDRFIEWELTEVCEAEGMGIISWAPLRGGWLTGRYKRDMSAGDLPTDSRIGRAEKEGWAESWNAYNTERTWQIVETVEAIAEETGQSMPQVALNWVKDRPGITSPIIGASKMSHLQDNLGAVGWSLSDEQRQRLDDVSETEPPYYPYVFIRDAIGNR